MRSHKPYIPQTTGELVDQLGGMMLQAPTFVDRTGFFRQSIDTEFQALNGGIEAIRSRLGEERYLRLTAMSQRMRALFEADPEDTTGDTQIGRGLIDEMQQMLMNRRNRG